ncbi:Esterase/lipase/thioesterase [Heterobasidion irregulare TC 32-1]|uniref:Esterase/lipase/thioesterase n=1 Tax=Heterobasidion irregulare (strain TC 32-1) TaxID=747525 RepID=W4JZQ4_HETIT|nr:Esterase/lipase/thioesterase [Heterobasidion irregulare TC 32-1]ETW79058.1 Esterase/lipase/thioesterase [Heterobasidion irregulare TC 32-1]
MAISGSEVHLLVLIHGMWGNPTHLAEMYRIIQEVKGKSNDVSSRLHVLLAEANKDAHTYDGIDWGGERVAQEIFDEIEKIEGEGKKVTHFSITGYSLGGLLSRYVVGILYQRDLFKTITPINFNTVATPHIGLLRYTSFWSRLSSTLGPTLLSRTGEQFYGVDVFSERGRPLLEVMADPKRPFYQGLSLFPHIRIYANTVNDLTVPYITAAIEPEDPFYDHKTTGLQIEFDEKYSPIVKSWTLPDTPPSSPPKPRIFTWQWFKNHLPRLALPPFLQRRFPLNILVFIALPILIPMFFILLLVRLALSARSSRKRIMLLEKDTSASGRLAQVVGELERQMEDVVVDFIDSSSSYRDESPAASDPSPPFENSHERDSVRRDSATKAKLAAEPHLTERQYKMIASLNAIPQLKKERVFLDPMRNSHATIISRDVQSFKFHRQGEGVLRHWADHFIL